MHPPLSTSEVIGEVTGLEGVGTLTIIESFGSILSEMDNRCQSGLKSVWTRTEKSLALHEERMGVGDINISQLYRVQTHGCVKKSLTDRHPGGRGSEVQRQTLVHITGP